MTNELLSLKRSNAQLGDHDELEATFAAEPFDLYGRHHEVPEATAKIGVTYLQDGVHLDLRVRATVETTCDRTLEPVELDLQFGDSDLVRGPNSRELSVQDWKINLPRYASRALPNEVPMQVFAPGTEPVQPERKEDEIDPRWRGLDDLFASGF